MCRRHSRNILAVLVVALVAASGCQFVKAGTRCRAGAEPGRDANFVLFCVNGRWKRTLTIDQAAHFLLSRVPTSIDRLGGAYATTVGSATPLELAAVVRSPYGDPISGVDVTFSVTSAPAFPGSSASFVDGPVVQTGADGIARIHVLPNTVAGGFTVWGSVAGVKTPASFEVTSSVGAPDDLQIISGDLQTPSTFSNFAPVVVRAVDAYGNGLPGRELLVDYDDQVIGGVPDMLQTDGSGYLTLNLSALGVTGSDYIAIALPDGAGGFFVAEIDFTIV